MDNIKNDNYFSEKISDDLSFIVKYTKDIDKEELSKNATHSRQHSQHIPARI